MTGTRWFFYARMMLLSSALLGVVLYAVRDTQLRRARTEWRRTLDVAVVLVTDGTVDAAATETLKSRVPALGERLKHEFHRYRPNGEAPFAFVVYGPVPLGKPLPAAPSDAWHAPLVHAWELSRFTGDVDDRAQVPTRGFDARLYVVLRPASGRAVVEGLSEHGGRVAVALIELERDTVDLALFVGAHELFHTLGAHDHYYADGTTLVPNGLAEPELTPTFPQRYAEVMARNRPLSASEEARPESLSELAVGRYTAEAIGWLR